ncbi:MAG: histidine kinase, partial [Arenicella sp.]|nr:histidine kinase [Arenicella sp.]
MKSNPFFSALPLFSKLGLLVFWLAVFIINAGPHWEVYVSNRELIETAGMVTALQMLVALVTLKVLAPKVLDKGQVWRFCLYMFLLIFIASNINIVIRYFYLEPLYPLSYKGFLSMFGEMTFLQRIDPRWTMRYIIFSKLPNLVFPTVLILAYGFYQKQQALLRIREQKRTAELDALKNQLNPHFIFNTLNNIYALALKKSDQTAVAIEKLSGILDYVVYRCTDKYVSLDAEVKLIEDYIALEKIRYGKRLNVSFEKRITTPKEIAPLLLLTLLENACKHSTQEELNQAQVVIQLETTEVGIMAKISNSKPKTVSPNIGQDKVGLN